MTGSKWNLKTQLKDILWALLLLQLQQVENSPGGGAKTPEDTEGHDQDLLTTRHYLMNQWILLPVLVLTQYIALTKVSKINSIQLNLTLEALQDRVA